MTVLVRRIFATRTLTSGLVAAAALFVSAVSATAADFRELFTNPPSEARPWTFWYWMNGAYSREGITADLEAMKRVGLGGAYLVPIKDVPTPPLFEPSTQTLTPQWWEMLRYTFREADRLGLKIAMHVSDGFATAGGPWITPEKAMQKVVWTEALVEGGHVIEQTLAQPAAFEGFYRDIAVLAFPAPEGSGISTRTVPAKLTSSVSGFDASVLIVPGNTQRLRSDGRCWVQYEFARPFTCRSLVIQPDGANYAALRPIVEVSDDGRDFRSLGRLETPRHGWQDWDAPYTFSIKPTTGRYFRIVYDLSEPEPGAEDLDSAKWRNVVKVRTIELFSAAAIPQYEGKSGAVWRRSSRADADLIPDRLCVPVHKIINLTRQITADGRLRWKAPSGKWMILRIGHTATGHRNETAGAGKGLECDKLDPAAARFQLDQWFGETIRQVGPELAGRVLKIMHVDSWEAGSQNWTANFPTEFLARRGYDIRNYLPVFAGVPVGSAAESERVLYDVRRTIEDLTHDAFFSTLASYAREHNLTFTAETTAPTMMGDGMRHFASVDVPMGEFWLRSPTHDKPNDVHDAISAAHVYGKPIVMSEAFTERNMRWDEHPGMLKALGDHNYALGINRFLLHVFTHNPWLDRKPGMTLSNIGLFFQRDQVWFEQARPWIDYLTRCQTLLQQGRHVADVVYFTGEEMPARAILPERRVPSLPNGYTADSINKDALVRLAEAKDGRLVLPGGASYAALVVPPTTVMSTEVLGKISNLVSAGVAVIGPHPKLAPGSQPVLPKLKPNWSSERTLERALADRGVAPDMLTLSTAGEPMDGVVWTHRSADAGELFFVSNQRDEARTVRLSIREVHGTPHLFDAVSGEIRQVEAAQASSGRTELGLELAANGSVFMVFTRDQGEKPATPDPQRALVQLGEIRGPWSVDFDPRYGGPAERTPFWNLISWAKHPLPGIRNYSGPAEYHAEFQWDPAKGQARVFLDLGSVANLATVRVNDTECGTVWTAPYRVDVTRALRPGLNRLQVRVTNTWANRLIGDKPLASDKRVTWTTANPLPEDAPLLPAGLLGPVTLHAEQTRP